VCRQVYEHDKYSVIILLIRAKPPFFLDIIMPQLGDKPWGKKERNFSLPLLQMKLIAGVQGSR